MRRRLLSLKVGLLTVLGTVLALGAGCDAQLRAAVENGLITASTSFLTAFLRAGINVVLDPNSNT